MKRRFTAFFLPLILSLIFSTLVMAEGSADEKSPDGKKIEYKFSIQVNVVRICANGRFFDLLEADTAGAGAWIKPYVVEVVSKSGESIACEAETPEQSKSKDR